MDILLLLQNKYNHNNTSHPIKQQYQSLRKSYSSCRECIHPVVDRARATMVKNKPKNISIPSGGRSTYSDITSGQPKQGRESGNRGRGGNNNRRPNNRGGRGGNHNPNKAKKSSFEGAYVELKGAIFNIGSG